MSKKRTTASFDVRVVEDYTQDGGVKTNWMRIGGAFEDKDSRGFDVQVSTLPVGGKLVLRLYEPREA